MTSFCLFVRVREQLLIYQWHAYCQELNLLISWERHVGGFNSGNKTAISEKFLFKVKFYIYFRIKYHFENQMAVRFDKKRGQWRGLVHVKFLCSAVSCFLYSVRSRTELKESCSKLIFMSWKKLQHCWQKMVRFSWPCSVWSKSPLKLFFQAWNSTANPIVCIKCRSNIMSKTRVWHCMAAYGKQTPSDLWSLMHFCVTYTVASWSTV